MKIAKIILVVLLIIDGSCCFSQRIVSSSDISNIFSTVLQKLNLAGKKAFVIKETEYNSIKNFDFKHIENYVVGIRGFDLYRDSSWKSFLFSVDTGQIRNHKVYISPATHDITFIKENERDFSKMLVNPISMYGIVSFSPIILSSDANKAFVISKSLRPSAGRSSSAFFLSKNNNTWEVEKTILLEVQ